MSTQAQLRARPSAMVKSLLSNKLTIAVGAIIALFVFGEIISPGFLSFNHLMSVLRLSVFLGIVALGQSLVVMAGGEGIDLSVGAVVSLGVVVASSFLMGKDANIPVAIVAVVASGFAIGLANGVGISYIGIPPLIMTLAMSSVVEGLSLLYTRGYPSGTASPLLESAGNGRVAGDPHRAPPVDRRDRRGDASPVPQALGRRPFRRGRQQRHRGAFRNQREAVPHVRVRHQRGHLRVRGPDGPRLHRARRISTSAPPT